LLTDVALRNKPSDFVLPSELNHILGSRYVIFCHSLLALAAAAGFDSSSSSRR
jgi:hypothetical protein